MNEKIPYDLLARYLANECSAEEKKEVEDWINLSEENKRIMYEMEHIWKSKSTAYAPDTEYALKKVHQRMEGNQVRKISMRTQMLRIASVLFIAAGLFWIVRNSFTGNALITETNTTSQAKEIVLPDGSKVWLNSATTIKYKKNFGRKVRSVSLSGETYFDVTRHPDMPFIIETENSEIKVLGTSFNVKAFDADTLVCVSVTEGLVAFTPKENDTEQEIKLTAGETGTLNINERKITKQKTLGQNHLSWKSGELVFEGSMLKDAIKEISAFYNIEIILADTALYSKELYTRLKKDKPETVAVALQAMGNIEKKENGTIIISIE